MCLCKNVHARALDEAAVAEVAEPCIPAEAVVHGGLVRWGCMLVHAQSPTSVDCDQLCVHVEGAHLISDVDIQGECCVASYDLVTVIKIDLPLTVEKQKHEGCIFMPDIQTVQKLCAPELCSLPCWPGMVVVVTRDLYSGFRAVFRCTSVQQSTSDKHGGCIDQSEESPHDACEITNVCTTEAFLPQEIVFGPPIATFVGYQGPEECVRTHSAIFPGDDDQALLDRMNGLSIRQTEDSSPLKACCLSSMQSLRSILLSKGQVEHSPRKLIALTGMAGSGKKSLIHIVLQELDFGIFVFDCCELLMKPTKVRQLFTIPLCIHGPHCIILSSMHTLAVSKHAGEGSLFEHRLRCTMMEFVSNVSHSHRHCTIIGLFDDIPSAFDTPFGQVISHEVLVPCPTQDQRKAALQHLLHGLSADVSVDEISAATPGFVLANLKFLVNRISRESSASIEECIRITAPSILRESTVLPNSKESGLIQALPKLYGLDQQLSQIRMFVNWGLNVKSKIDGGSTIATSSSSLQVYPPKGILLTGQSGCGKSAVCAWLRGVYGNRLNIFHVVASSVISSLLGQSERQLSDLFNKARQASPSIIFLDGVECLGMRRGTDTTQEKTMERLLSTLLTEIDGAVQHENPQTAVGGGCMVIAATAFPSSLDPALVRAGRLHTRIHLGKPDKKAFGEMLSDLAKQFGQSAQDQDFNGEYSGLLELAAQQCVNAGFTAGDVTDFHHKFVMSKFRDAIAHSNGGRMQATHLTVDPHSFLEFIASSRVADGKAQ